jgi:signal transduction histidine kinase
MSIINSETRIFCRLDGKNPKEKEEQRLNALNDLGLLEIDSSAIFDEATQTAAHFVGTPICILGVMTADDLLIKSAFGLSRMGLMNELAVTRKIPRAESFCTYIVDSEQVLAIHDTFDNPILASSILVQHYGIRAYLGAPLIAKNGECIGAIAVMDTVPHNFTHKDIDFLSLTARWVLSEFERDLLKNTDVDLLISQQSKKEKTSQYHQVPNQTFLKELKDKLSEITEKLTNNPENINLVKLKLLNYISQDLRTPLTSIMGMASVLNREVYGPLTTKQKEYLDIIHNSGQHLVSLVDEIINLEVLETGEQTLNLSSQDMEMLCQQVINSLEKVRLAKQQDIRLTIAAQNRLWVVDKEKVRQITYYLLLNIMQIADIGNIIHVHVSRKYKKLYISMWFSHPWFGESMHQPDFPVIPPIAMLVNSVADIPNSNLVFREEISTHQKTSIPLGSTLMINSELTMSDKQINRNDSRENLGLLLSLQLAEIHQGTINIETSPELGYRYVIILPQLMLEE